MVVLDIVREGLSKSLSTLLLLVLIVFPVMLLFEYAGHYGVLEKVSKRLGWLTRCLTLPPEAAFPLLLGMTLGIFYGTAMIIEYGRQGLLKKRDLLLLGIFLAVNHGIIEDNLIFSALGVNFFFLLLFRLAAGVAVTRAAALFLSREHPVMAAEAQRRG